MCHPFAQDGFPNGSPVHFGLLGDFGIGAVRLGQCSEDANDVFCGEIADAVAVFDHRTLRLARLLARFVLGFLACFLLGFLSRFLLLVVWAQEKPPLRLGLCWLFSVLVFAFQPLGEHFRCYWVSHVLSRRPVALCGGFAKWRLSLTGASVRVFNSWDCRPWFRPGFCFVSAPEHPAKGNGAVCGCRAGPLRFYRSIPNHPRWSRSCSPPTSPRISPSSSSIAIERTTQAPCTENGFPRAVLSWSWREVIDLAIRNRC